MIVCGSVVNETKRTRKEIVGYFYPQKLLPAATIHRPTKAFRKRDAVPHRRRRSRVSNHFNQQFRGTRQGKGRGRTDGSYVEEETRSERTNECQGSESMHEPEHGLRGMQSTGGEFGNAANIIPRA